MTQNPRSDPARLNETGGHFPVERVFSLIGTNHTNYNLARLARDIRNELPEVKGFSKRNIGYMIRFFREYGEPPILQQAVAKLPGSSEY